VFLGFVRRATALAAAAPLEIERGFLVPLMLAHFMECLSSGDLAPPPVAMRIGSKATVPPKSASDRLPSEVFGCLQLVSLRAREGKELLGDRLLSRVDGSNGGCLVKLQE
jgi:hypothetical protein